MKMVTMVACAAALGFAVPARGAVITLIDEGGVTGSAAEAGFRIAAAYWGSILTNDVKITIAVDYRAFGGVLLGGATSSYMDYATADWVAGVKATRSTSGLDQGAVLPTLTDGGASFVTTGVDADGNNDSTVTRSVAGGETASSTTLYLQTALVKAIGGEAQYSNANTNRVDAYLTFDAEAVWDFDPTDDTDAGAYDFLSIAIHEIGHALGFSSGVDTLDAWSSPGGDTDGGDQNDYPIYSALDMFRYGEDGVIDLSAGSATYFSTDGGKTAVADNSFASGVRNGDGHEASHWRDEEGSDEIGTMSPLATRGVADVVTALDLAAFDAIGWNLSDAVRDDAGYRGTSADIYRAFASAVPEPASWATMLIGFAATGVALRRRRGGAGRRAIAVVA